jgi:hypothetical protein
VTGVSASPACCDDEAVRIAHIASNDAALYCNDSGTIAIIIREINDNTRKPRGIGQQQPSNDNARR